MTSAQPYSIESYTSDGSRPSVSFWVITNDGNPDAGRAMRATWLRSERDVHLCVANATPHAHEPGIEALPVRVPWSPAYVRKPAPRPRIRNRFLRSKVYAILLRMCASSSEFSMLLDDDTAVNTTRLYQWLHLWNLPNRSRLLFEGNRSQPSDSNVLYGGHMNYERKNVGGGPGILFNAAALERLCTPACLGNCQQRHVTSRHVSKFGGGDQMLGRCAADCNVTPTHIAGFDRSSKPSQWSISNHYVKATARSETIAGVDERCNEATVPRAKGIARHACAPHFAVVGVVKGGTTSLFAYLTQSPDFVAPERKELRVWRPVRAPLANGVGYTLENYTARFPLIKPGPV